jgi:hypothetical protein
MNEQQKGILILLAMLLACSKKIIIILMSGIILIPILISILILKNFRSRVWHFFNGKTKLYSVIPDNKVDQLFTACVNYLVIVANYIGMTYNEINIWIFCIIWPLVTLVLFVLAII